MRERREKGEGEEKRREKNWLKQLNADKRHSSTI